MANSVESLIKQLEEVKINNIVFLVKICLMNKIFWKR